jgi:hypothetical protein
MTNRQTFHDGVKDRQMPAASRFGQFNGYDAYRKAVCVSHAEGGAGQDRGKVPSLPQLLPKRAGGYCGKPPEHCHGKKRKRFCNDRRRSDWWNKNRDWARTKKERGPACAKPLKPRGVRVIFQKPLDLIGEKSDRWYALKKYKERTENNA